MRTSCVFIAASLLLVNSAFARAPERIEEVQREMRIVADVMRSVLRDELKAEARVTRVDAQYLADQGVLVTVSLNMPWMKFSGDGDHSFEFNGHISIPEIPRMVEEILSDLQIDIEPFAPDALEALRELRGEQRELRLSQRNIRSRLREKRRTLVRSDDAGERRAIEEDIRELEQELVNVDAEYDSLSTEIDAQYQALKDYREPPQPPRPPETSQDIDAVIARAACDYGGTLKSLSGDEYLTISIHRGDRAEYYAFRMDHVKECGANDMRAERLLELAYQYES